MSDIKICFNTNERWLRQTQRALYDIVIRKNPDTNITFYIIFDTIDASNEFEAFKTIPNVTIITETINPQKEFNNKIMNYCFSWLGAFKHIKFLLPEMELFKYIDKLLYLDVDVLARKDLTELYNLDLEGHAVGSVKDYSHLRRHDYKTVYEIGNKIEPGCLVLSLDKLREIDFTNKCKEKAGRFTGDLGLMQFILGDDIKPIHPKYQIPYHFICTEKIFRVIEVWNDYCGTNYNNIDELVADSFLWHYCGDKDKFYNEIPSVKTSFDLSSQRLVNFLNTGEIMNWKPEDDTSLYVNFN